MVGRETHLDKAAIRALILGTESSAEVRAHFLQCPECQLLVEGSSDAGRDLIRYLGPALRLLSTASLGEIKLAERKIDRTECALELCLRDRDPGHLDSPAVCWFSLGWCILRKAELLRHRDPRFLFQLCKLALKEVEELEGSSDLLARDLVARLQAELGNCHRLQNRLRDAAPLLQNACALAARSDDPNTRAEVLWRAAALSRDSYDFSGAEAQGQRASAIFRRIGATRQAEQVEYLLATLPYYQGNHQLAEDRLVTLHDQRLEDELTKVSTVHLLGRLRILRGDVWAAAALLGSVKNLSAQWRDCPSIHANIRWLHALILGYTGSPRRAAQLLKSVGLVFVEQEIPVDAALVAVDRAFFLNRSGEFQLASETAHDALRILDGCGERFPLTFTILGRFADAVSKRVIDMVGYITLARELDRGRFERPRGPGD